VEDVAGLLQVPDGAVERVVIANHQGLPRYSANRGQDAHRDAGHAGRQKGASYSKWRADGRVTSTVSLPAPIMQEALGHAGPASCGDPSSAEHRYDMMRKG
jgi:hypothetical protein